MISRHPSMMAMAPSRWPVILAAAALALILCFAGLRLAGAAEAASADHCVACHTDPAKLQALTPPDPPPAEEGEG